MLVSENHSFELKAKFNFWSNYPPVIRRLSTHFLKKKFFHKLSTRHSKLWLGMFERPKNIYWCHFSLSKRFWRSYNHFFVVSRPKKSSVLRFQKCKIWYFKKRKLEILILHFWNLNTDDFWRFDTTKKWLYDFQNLSERMKWHQ